MHKKGKIACLSDQPPETAWPTLQLNWNTDNKMADDDESIDVDDIEEEEEVEEEEVTDLSNRWNCTCISRHL